MFKNLGGAVNRFSWWILGATVIFLIVAGTYGTGVFGKLGSGGFDNKSSQSYKAAQVIQNKLPASQASVIVLLRDKHGAAVDDPDFRAEATRMLDSVKADPSVQGVSSYYSIGAPSLVSKDKMETFAVVSLKGDVSTQAGVVAKLRPRLASDRLDVKLGGTAAINDEITSTIGKDLSKAESISFTLLAILLIIVFRSFIAGLLPLILGAISVLGAFLVTRLLTTVTDISQYAINVIILLGLGLAVDYSLFIVSRFREELRTGASVPAALTKTMETAGRTVLFSGTTVILSLLGLLLFPLNFLQSMGLGGAAAVAVAMLAALLVLPAILARLGRGVNALSFGSVRQERRAQKGGRATAEQRASLWYRVSRSVMHHPMVTLVVILVPLILVGTPFLHARFGTADYRSLPVGSEARVVSETLKNDFVNSQDSPIEVVFQTGSNILESANISSLYDYTQQLEALPQVKSVDSIVSGGSQALAKQGYLDAYADPSSPASRAAASRVGGNTTVLNIAYKPDPLSPDTQKLVNDIRNIASPAGTTVLVGGQPAALADLLDTLARSLPYAAVFIVVALFILLFLMLGSLVIPLQAIILNVLSLSASFGALVWIFQEGHLSSVFNFTPDGTINATQPVLIFAIAFGLSMDYAVFLLSRIKEQYDLSGDTQEAIATGIQKTGSIITSAAVLLFVVVAAFATSSIPIIKQIGVGLSSAILIDAFVIRMLLVPAVMKLLGRANWWAPRPLKRLAARAGLGERS